MDVRPGSTSTARLEEYTDDLIDFIRTPLVQQITGGIHVNDALVYDAWDALPQEWTAWWESVPDHRIAQQALIDSIDEDRTLADDEHRPASLTRWLQSLRTLCLSRGQRPMPVFDLPDVLKDRMNTKKIAEVSVAVAFIERACRESGITRVVDMGSGQGYLSASLAFLFPSLRVLAIDGSESQVAGSKAFAASLGVSEDGLTHLVRYINGPPELVDEIEAWAGGEKCMLVGLHACGQLSEHMLRYFTAMPSIVSLGAVGCCYNHIVPRSESCPEGFPISSRMRASGVTLSPTALMTGCQAPNKWERADPAKAKSTQSKRRFYRALLEKVFYDNNIRLDADQRPTWGIRKGDLDSFQKFARRAMASLGIEENRISTEDLSAYEERYRNYEGKVAILWTLSVLCCKIVESVIAMDRYWYLVEQGAEDVEVVPIFDYRISPRNLMLVATKRE